MNTKLLARLEKLESAMGGTEKEGLTVFIRSVWADNGKPAAIQAEATGARTVKRDWSLSREPDESEDGFMERAGATVPRGDDGVAVILLTYPEDEGG